MSWKPIETAPQDDLVMLNVAGEPVIAAWHDEAFWEGDTVDTSQARPGWIIYEPGADGELRIRDRIRPSDAQPSAWRPVPAPGEMDREVAEIEARASQIEREQEQARLIVARRLEELEQIQRELVEVERAEAAQRLVEEEQERQRLADEAAQAEAEQAAEEQRLQDEAAAEERLNSIAAGLLRLTCDLASLAGPMPCWWTCWPLARSRLRAASIEQPRSASPCGPCTRLEKDYQSNA